MKTFILLSLCCLLLARCTPAKRSFDFSKGKDKLDAYLKIRLSLDENETSVFYWTGSVYSFVPGERSLELFKFEGFNIAQIKKTEKGYDQLAREVLFYEDQANGKIVEHWFSPFLKDSVEVLHIWNNPANFRLVLENFSNGRMPVYFTDLPGDEASMFVDAWVMYPSPLPKKDFPENSRSDTYQAGEIFNFFYHEHDLQNPRRHSVPVQFSWMRMTDFLPWMRMGERPGYLVYSGRGSRLEGGFEALPKHLKEYVMKNDSAFARPPEVFTEPNMNSWRYFKLKKGKS